MTQNKVENLVYVVNKNGNPLMPCKPTKAKHLLKLGRAKIINYRPFTIQLKWDCEENLQPTTLGIDKGSKFTGLAIVNDVTGELLLQAELKHRTDVSDKMTTRAANRRARRGRLWYRQSRWQNRSSMRRSRLPQSIKTNADEVLRVVRKLPVSINKIVVEDVLVDVRKLTNPEVRGKQYQESNRLDENLRLACLMRDDFHCQNYKCRGNVKLLHAHHIVWRSKGGKNTITNLITLCKKCHGDLHQGKWSLSISGADGFRDQMAQRTMQGKNYLYKELHRICPDLGLVFGYETAERRHSLSLAKTHMVDGFVIANGNIYTENNQYRVNFRPEQTRRQYFDQPRKGHGRVRYQVNEELDGFKKGDIVKVLYKGESYVKQINAIYSARKHCTGRLAFSRVIGEPSDVLPKNCVLLERQKTVIFNNIL